MCIYACMWVVMETRRGASESLELEFQVVSLLTLNQVLWNNSKHS